MIYVRRLRTLLTVCLVTAPTPLAASSDIQLSVASVPASSPAGQLLTCTFNVTGGAGSPAVLSAVFPPSTIAAGLAASVSGGGSCSVDACGDSPGQTLTCTWASLTSAGVTISMTPQGAPGTSISAVVGVSQVAGDPDMSNNSVGAITQITAPLCNTPAASTNGPLCAGQTLTLYTPAVAGATYSWTGPNGFASTLQSPSIPGATTAASGTYSVRVSVNGCTSPAGSVAVSVVPTPAAPAASNNGPICAGSTLMLTTSTVPGATYAWTGPNGFTSSLQNPSIGSAPSAATGTYTVAVTVNGCSSASGTTTAIVNDLPPTPGAFNNGPIFEGETLFLSTQPSAPPSLPGEWSPYNWRGPNGFISVSQNPSIPNVSVAASGSYGVWLTARGCPSALGHTTVTVNPRLHPPTGLAKEPEPSMNLVWTPPDNLASTDSVVYNLWLTGGNGYCAAGCLFHPESHSWYTIGPSVGTGTFTWALQAVSATRPSAAAVVGPSFVITGLHAPTGLAKEPSPSRNLVWTPPDNLAPSDSIVYNLWLTGGTGYCATGCLFNPGAPSWYTIGPSVGTGTFEWALQAVSATRPSSAPVVGPPFTLP